MAGTGKAGAGSLARGYSVYSSLAQNLPTDSVADNQKKPLATMRRTSDSMPDKKQ